jgi:bifunctional DNA primase/polymerase-like protein
MANIPDPQQNETFLAGRLLIQRGLGDWKIFLLRTDDPTGKHPQHNCARCHTATGTCKDPEGCTCLLCHGFYAATNDSRRFREMVAAKPDGFLAVRTGAASRLVVIDAESSAEPGEPSGIDILDQWEQWTDGHSLPNTLTARSVSGGLHLYYRLPVSVEVKTGNRVLPSVDIKGRGGYVGAVGSRKGTRSWIDTSVPLAEIPADFLDWYLSSRRRYGGSRGSGGGGGQSPGYDYRAFFEDHCPSGHRDYFFNDLLFRQRKRDKTKERAQEIAREAWEKCAQPPNARWSMPWDHVMYKLDRIWNQVDVPTKPTITDQMQSLARSWQRAAGLGKTSDKTSDIEIRKTGAITMVRRAR